MSEFYLTGKIGIVVWDVHTKLSFTDYVLAVFEVNQKISGCPFESIFDSDNLEFLPRFCNFCGLHFIQKFNNFLSRISCSFTPKKVINEKAKSFLTLSRSRFIF